MIKDRDWIFNSSSNVLFFWSHRCWWRMLKTKCVGDKSHHQYQELGTNITFWRIMWSGVWCWWQMLVPQNVFIDRKYVFSKTYWSLTSHSGILWSWWPIQMSPTCRKMSSTYFFLSTTSINGHQWWLITIKPPTSPSPIFYPLKRGRSHSSFTTFQ